jgi:hypothetical protein
MRWSASKCTPVIELGGIHERDVRDRVGTRDETVGALEPRAELPSVALRPIGRLAFASSNSMIKRLRASWMGISTINGSNS